MLKDQKAQRIKRLSEAVSMGLATVLLSLMLASILSATLTGIAWLVTWLGEGNLHHSLVRLFISAFIVCEVYVAITMRRRSE